MKSFKAEQVDEIVRYVLTAKDTVLLQEDDGHAVTVPEGLIESEKKQIIEKFCAKVEGKVCVYSPPPRPSKAEVLGVPSRQKK